MPEDWSPEEVAATVADYLAMLGHQFLSEPYNKKEHNRQLQRLLRRRSAGAIEFKHQNISAVLIELDFDYIHGYKPRGNYQELLRTEVVAQLSRDTTLARAAELTVTAPVLSTPIVESLADVLVPAPVGERERKRTYERQVPISAPRLGIDYVERESRNASLGSAGEEFALRVEHQRLWEAGEGRLADKIEHVSRSQGDGLGYDILSFETDGRERLIEVKTTSFGAMTAFFVSKKEAAISEERAQNFSLYRIFNFQASPRLFVLPGSLREFCNLDPTQYRASLL